MKNLFVMHTQYNLILSAAVMSGMEQAENTLVLYSEFSLNDAMRTALGQVFDRVFVVRENFEPLERRWAEVRKVRVQLKKLKFLRKEHFDNIYMSQERMLDMVLCTWAKRNNPTICCYNIEEDAYYSVDEKLNADDYRITETLKERIARILQAILMVGYPYNYKELCYCYGMSSEYHGVCLLYPHLARRELQGKQLRQITAQELTAGIKAIYGSAKGDYPPASKYTLFFFDLMSRYKNPEAVKEIAKKFLADSAKEGRKVLFKYHPRETDKFTDFADVFEIPHLVPAEKVLFDLKDTDTVVMGNATTSCIVAAKLGHKVISICKIEAPSNKKMHSVMQKMDILCIENSSDIKSLI